MSGPTSGCAGVPHRAGVVELDTLATRTPTSAVPPRPTAARTCSSTPLTAQASVPCGNTLLINMATGNR